MVQDWRQKFTFQRLDWLFSSGFIPVLFLALKKDFFQQFSFNFLNFFHIDNTTLGSVSELGPNSGYESNYYVFGSTALASRLFYYTGQILVSLILSFWKYSSVRIQLKNINFWTKFLKRLPSSPPYLLQLHKFCIKNSRLQTWWSLTCNDV